MTRPVSTYGVVILPSPPVRSKITAMREPLGHLAANLPPHISVKSPFLFRGTGAWVVDILEAVCARFEPFELQLRGFGSFGTELIYVQVEESPTLRELHRAIVTELTGYIETLKEQYEGDAYTPHLTLADHLGPAEYASARRTLNGTYPRFRFVVDQVHLLRGKGKWGVTRSIPLGDG